jgi:diaminopimelate epimerase
MQTRPSAGPTDMTIAFAKMHGLGNDFVIVDARRRSLEPTPERIVRLAERRTGIGFDQLILLEPGAGTADVAMRIFNRDGSSAEACGNAARCIGRLLADEHPPDRPVAISTPAGVITALPRTDGRVTVELGPPAFDWERIPLAASRDTLDLGLAAGPLRGGAAVNVGNPHVVFVTDRLRDVDLARWGPVLEHDPLFPEQTNVEIIRMDRDGATGNPVRDRITMRVWERGAGLTRACGTGACAALAAAHRLGIGDRAAAVRFLDGGVLDIEWREHDGRISMTGDAELSFRGELPEAALL